MSQLEAVNVDVYGMSCVNEACTLVDRIYEQLLNRMDLEVTDEARRAYASKFRTNSAIMELADNDTLILAMLANVQRMFSDTLDLIGVEKLSVIRQSNRYEYKSLTVLEHEVGVAISKSVAVTDDNYTGDMVDLFAMLKTTLKATEQYKLNTVTRMNIAVVDDIVKRNDNFMRHARLFVRLMTALLGRTCKYYKGDINYNKRHRRLDTFTEACPVQVAMISYPSMKAMLVGSVHRDPTRTERQMFEDVYCLSTVVTQSKMAQSI